MYLGYQAGPPSSPASSLLLTLWSLEGGMPRGAPDKTTWAQVGKVSQPPDWPQPSLLVPLALGPGGEGMKSDLPATRKQPRLPGSYKRPTRMGLE